MPHTATARRPARPIRIRRTRVAGLVLVLAALVAVLAHRPAPPSTGAVALPSGAVPRNTTVFDDGVAGVDRLDPDLRSALRRAASDAADDGLRLLIDSGWRSPRYQRRLLDRAVAKYGSRAEARRWVATPQTSAHVKGDAVDIGPAGAAAWLAAHGAAYGLCRVYDNEPWHYELRPDAAAQGCPTTYADPTRDPRMQ